MYFFLRYRPIEALGNVHAWSTHRINRPLKRTLHTNDAQEEISSWWPAAGAFVPKEFLTPWPEWIVAEPFE